MANHLIDIKAVSFAALRRIDGLIEWVAPGGHRKGNEYVVRNPTRIDRNPGSFRINLVSGKWADFATGDSGGDIVSLVAYIQGVTQYEAACRLSDALGGGYAR